MRDHAGSNEDRKAAEARYQRALERSRQAKAETCRRCGSIKPQGQSCGCFDNGCE